MGDGVPTVSFPHILPDGKPHRIEVVPRTTGSELAPLYYLFRDKCVYGRFHRFLSRLG